MVNLGRVMGHFHWPDSISASHTTFGPCRREIIKLAETVVFATRSYIVINCLGGCKNSPTVSKVRLEMVWRQETPFGGQVQPGPTGWAYSAPSDSLSSFEKREEEGDSSTPPSEVLDTPVHCKCNVNASCIYIYKHSLSYIQSSKQTLAIIHRLTL